MSSEPMAVVPVEHSPVAGLTHDQSGGISNVILGMILFITSEVMFFAGLFAAYFNVRANAPIWPPLEFANKLHVLPTAEEPIPLVTIATAVLIISSLTCQLGVWSIRRGDHRGLVRNIGVTLVLGILFLTLQGWDYIVLYSQGIRLDAGTFGTTFYTLTGFHGAHVLAGVSMLSVVTYRGMAGQFSSRHHDMVEATSLYWHFVDVVWIVLFSTIYLVPNFG
jgi:cytochrome c oxidase subunit 3